LAAKELVDHLWKSQQAFETFAKGLINYWAKTRLFGEKMRISFRVPANVYDRETEQPLTDQATLSALDGWRYEGGSTCNYLDMELVDQAITGGTIRAAWTALRGLEVIIDYWAPDSLPPSSVNHLRDQSLGQLSDGIGEGGFEVTLDRQQMLIVANTDKTPEVERVYDGKPIVMPSRIARAAHDGNMPLLEAALVSGEPIDSEIQGYSALHLAIIYGRAEAALMLISKGANTNKITGDGDETPLHLCALSNSLNDRDSAMVAQALLKHGADASKRTASGNTAESFAEKRNKVTLLTILREGRKS
jgi:hypothetical protein